jgi:hypothetical protein
MNPKFSVFVASSTEGLEIAEALQLALEPTADVELWTQGVFDLTSSSLESLIREVDKVDFAVLVLTSDDLIESRSVQAMAPRDNVLFELGLFMGHLGRQRCFFVFEKEQTLKLPSDLLGIAAATYRLHKNGNLQASLGAAATQIKKRINTVGKRPVFQQINIKAELSNIPIPNISGKWAGYAPDAHNKLIQKSILTLEQYGQCMRGSVERQTRTGVRKFEYEGRFSSGQLVLFFEENDARGFIIGTLVLHLSSDLQTLTGKNTYYHHDTHNVVATDSIYKKIEP